MCIEIEIIDDIIDQEDNEGFNVDFEFVNGTGVTKGAIPQTMVIIVDDDGKTNCGNNELSSIDQNLMNSNLRCIKG